MNRKVGILATVAVLVVLALSFLVELRETAAASTLSLGARGWLAARLYLERRGVETVLLDRPLDESSPPGVLVLAFPWQRGIYLGEMDAVRRKLLAGGTILFAYSGDEDARGETEVAEQLGLEWERLREPPPLGPLAWRRFVVEKWTLSAVDERRAPPLRVTAFARAPRAPEGADVLYRSPDGQPVVFARRSGGGRIVVLPAEAFANARILEAGNADLLESLGAFLGDVWSFDEYHHGLAAPVTAEERQPRVALDLLLAHLVLLYSLVVWRMSKRFGPVHQERALLKGSTRSFLLGLGALHDRLAHYRQAAQLLVSRARAFQPHIELPLPDDIESRADLVQLARAVAERQSTRKATSTQGVPH